MGREWISCVIDTRDFATTTTYRSILLNNNCILKSFLIIVANNTEVGGGIGGTGLNSIITQNRITKGKYGINVDSDPLIHNNLVDHISSGIFAFNSNSIIRQNVIYTDPNSQSAVVAGIRLEAFNNSYSPTVDSNYIELNRRGEGIRKSFGTNPTINNNTFILKHISTIGIWLSSSDSAKVYNNSIYAEE
ncbi:MAG TPA: hypothetical protein PK073_12285, partial [Ignavibacteriaceae bacterium]|nr:hypothetical protein [Ignavibacteriaceae bacterium]